MTLIRGNEEALSQLGALRFEIGAAKPRSPEKGKNPNPPRFAWLNFDQIAFLLTLSRTTAAFAEVEIVEPVRPIPAVGSSVFFQRLFISSAS